MRETLPVKKLYYKPRAHMPNNILPTEHTAADVRNIPLIRRTARHKAGRKAVLRLLPQQAAVILRLPAPHRRTAKSYGSPPCPFAGKVICNMYNFYTLHKTPWPYQLFFGDSSSPKMRMHTLFLSCMYNFAYYRLEKVLVIQKGGNMKRTMSKLFLSSLLLGTMGLAGMAVPVNAAEAPGNTSASPGGGEPKIKKITPRPKPQWSIFLLAKQ